MLKAHAQRGVHRAVQILHAQRAQVFQPRIGLPVRLDHIRQIDDLLQPRHARVARGVPADRAEHVLVLYAVNVLRHAAPGHSVHERLGFLHDRVNVRAPGRLDHLGKRHALGAVVKQPGQRGLLLILAENACHLPRGLLHAERVFKPLAIQLLFQLILHLIAFHLSLSHTVHARGYIVPPAAAQAPRAFRPQPAAA